MVRSSDDELWLHRGADVEALARGGLRGATPLGVWAGGPRAWDWAEVAAVLVG